MLHDHQSHFVRNVQYVFGFWPLTKLTWLILAESTLIYPLNSAFLPGNLTAVLRRIVGLGLNNKSLKSPFRSSYWSAVSNNEHIETWVKVSMSFSFSDDFRAFWVVFFSSQQTDRDFSSSLISGMGRKRWAYCWCFLPTSPISAVITPSGGRGWGQVRCR